MILARRPYLAFLFAAFILVLVLTFSQPPEAVSDRLAQWTTWRKPTPPPVNHDNPYTEAWLLHEQPQSVTLVVAKLRAENVSWIYDDLKPGLKHAVYLTNDQTEPLHTPVNKGHEAMAYLTYIIDTYEELPEVSIFMHAHSSTWHNVDLLGQNSGNMVRFLNLEKVVREGYVNMRCELDPGCPSMLKLDHLADDDSRYAEIAGMLATAFKGLFPGDVMPSSLSEPCCAQFAVSKKAIQRLPLQRYVDMRQWLIETKMQDQWSGRMFEYSWHYIFTGASTLCPNTHLCYCDAYGICFETARAWEDYQEILRSIHAFEDEHAWLPEDSTEQREKLSALLQDLRDQAERRKLEAFRVGSDIYKRREVLHDAWELMRREGQLPYQV